MWIMKRARVRLALLGVLVMALTVVVAACGGSSETTSTSTTAAPTTSSASTTSSVASSSTSVVLSGDEATIAANYVTFFDGTKPVADKVGLLENGQQYSKELETQAASPLGKMASVAVSSVTITSPTTADVTYSILVGGTPALPNHPSRQCRRMVCGRSAPIHSWHFWLYSRDPPLRRAQHDNAHLGLIRTPGMPLPGPSSKGSSQGWVRAARSSPRAPSCS